MQQLPPLLLDTELFSINQINNLPDEQRRQVYCRLVPRQVLQRLGIDPETLADGEGRSLLELKCSLGTSSVELSLYHVWGAADPAMYLQMADTPNNQIEVLLFIINDPYSERFGTDRLPDGTPTYFGTLGRNIEEEVRAMKAGLAPGQVHSGLGLTRRLIPTLEHFVADLNHNAVYIQPLAYHNAILFERVGFSYMLGLGRMEWIGKEFAPGGLLFKRLDGSTPFRRPGADTSVRGRSWAIHDGILGEPYAGVKMYKRVGVHAGVVTFPNAVW
ncbi:MAG: hypothetical protein B6I35_05440 [Anaerolineaceae bacterium 4572_32.2]|nr:MAG: hypothetical protein B6I35_05440 [Anaerolineaceae bacterium 4572_32.2]HEY72118.1 hypothetical protein [Thermoflexia bacterium]